MKEKVLILGGARSGKSSFAEKLACDYGQKVLYVATAEAGDREMKERIASHRKARPPAWTTLEAPLQVGRQIMEAFNYADAVLIDCITLLVSNTVLSNTIHSGDNVDFHQVEAGVMWEIDGLIQCMDGIQASFIIVSNEVGLGLVPDNTLGRLYRDVLGRANQRLAAYVDRVYFMVSGIPLVVKPQIGGEGPY